MKLKPNYIVPDRPRQRVTQQIKRVRNLRILVLILMLLDAYGLLSWHDRRDISPVCKQIDGPQTLQQQRFDRIFTDRKGEL
jgi:predicted chitinase